MTLTKYLGAPGMPQAIRVGTGVSGTLSYLASDGLSSVSEALDSSSGTVTAQQLYAPYGGTRYTNGAMPTSKGFTGQHVDATKRYTRLATRIMRATAAGRDRHVAALLSTAAAMGPLWHEDCDRPLAATVAMRDVV